ncbi:MAG: AAA family ATPase [Thermocrinis sp.]|uniref:AAA family ATPase n=1 Tax=Thermocrinis sp. TaxID=2024383 RepID=UPI003C0E87A7
MIVVLIGLSGSGKSFVANILHREFGFEWIRSDQIRKEMAGIEPTQRVKVGFSEGIYSEEWTRRVYERMLDLAEEKLREGKKVVLDATFLKAWQREKVKERFPSAIFIWVIAKEEEIIKRLSSRQDISDAGVETYLRQKEIFEPPEGVPTLDTSEKEHKVKEKLKELLNL